MKQVTIKGTTGEAGVSITSASGASDGMDGISEKKYGRILRVREQLSYTPSRLVRNLVRRKIRTIGIIMPDIVNPLYSGLMMRASDTVHKRGCQMLLCNSFRELRAERDYLKLLAEHQVEGTLILPIGPRSTESMSELIYNVPMVASDELTGQCGIPYVCADEERTGRITAEYLISRGCRSLLLVGFKPERLAHRYRAADFVGIAKVKRTPAQIHERNLDFRTSFEKRYNHFKRSLQSGLSIPDGIVTASDTTASDIIKACRENGIHTPGDFSLVGFGSITEELPHTELTTVAVSHEEQMEIVVGLLLGMMEGGTPVGSKAFMELGPWLVRCCFCKG